MKKILVLVFTIILGGCSVLDYKEPEYSFTPYSLVEEYRENEIEASVNYDDKYVSITGFIKSIDGDKDLVTIRFYGDVSCNVRIGIELMTELKEYDKIVLNGTVEGLSSMSSFGFYSVEITNCEFIELIDETDFITTAHEFSSLLIEDYENQIIEISGVVYDVKTTYENSISFDLVQYKESLKIKFDSDTDLSYLSKGDSIVVKGFVIKDWSGYKLVNTTITIVVE